MCFEDKVECKKDFEHCIGGCSGDLTSKLHYDFATMIAVSELNPDVLGEDGFFASAADCNVRQTVIEVALFEGGDSFNRFANRLQVASGMTAIDNTWCFENPLSCGIVERAIERSPGLRFVNGEFRHVYDGDPPMPPPPPTPPPRTLFYGPAPPNPSPPPINPPPYYQDAENCFPVPTPQFFGVDLEEFQRENADAAIVEYRSACVFVKRIVEKRRRIKSCFERVISPSPPPPPPTGGVESAQWAIEQEENRRINGDDAVYSAGSPDEGTMYVNEVKDGISETQAIISQLGNSNPILREFLGQAIGEMESSVIRVSDGTVKPSDYYGRRLMQRQFDYTPYMSDAIVDHPLMTKFKEGLPGIDRAGCQALCEGISITSNQTDKTECRALAFRRAYPTSTTDFTGRCYLLQNSGACKVADFASQLYTRQIQSEEVCHEFPSEYDNDLCIELPTTRTDTVSWDVAILTLPSHPLTLD